MKILGFKKKTIKEYLKTLKRSHTKPSGGLDPAYYNDKYIWQLAKSNPENLKHFYVVPGYDGAIGVVTITTFYPYRTMFAFYDKKSFKLKRRS